MAGAQVAETTYTPSGWTHEPLRLIIRRVAFRAEQIARLRGSRRLQTIHPDQLQMALDGEIDSVYGYSFILTDHPHQHTASVEHHHRHRAQIEERLKDTKTGQALRPPAIGRHQRQPRVDDRRAARRETSPPGSATSIRHTNFPTGRRVPYSRK
jgi:hypothetical protein